MPKAPLIYEINDLRLYQICTIISLQFRCSCVLVKIFKGTLTGRVCCILVKTAQIFNKEPFYNVKLLLEYREEDFKRFFREKTNYDQVLAFSLQYTEETWKKLTNFFKLQSISTQVIRSQT